jgi:hypothetical protein
LALLLKVFFKSILLKLKRHSFHTVFVLMCFIGLIYISSCEKLASGDSGFLEGNISIGPICPVERVPPDPACLPTAETYKAYPVSIWTSDGTKKIVQISPALDGSFSTALEPGIYLVVLEKDQNRPGSSNLPVKVSIVSKNTTLLNINIDTGIR